MWMMKPNDRFVLLTLLIGMFYNHAASQSIRGDTIFLEISEEVTVYFPSQPTKAEILPDPAVQERLYKVRTMNIKNSISIQALKKGKEQYLEVTEKDRRHLFVLSYKEGSLARSIDFSSKRKESERATAVKKNVYKLLTETDSLYNQVQNSPTDPELWKRVEYKYGQLASFVDDNDTGYVASRLEECRKLIREMEVKNYDEELKKGKDYLASKKYGDARKAFSKALQSKPEDIQASKYLKLTDSTEAKDYIDLGDEAARTRNPVLAKMHYQKALHIKADYPLLQDKFNQAKKNADPLIYKIERDKGDEAMRNNDLEEAREAYDSALSVKPDDRYARGQLKIVDAELGNIKKEEQNDAAYQGILATAKKLADKASTAPDYDAAIKEYERAKALIPDGKFPRKKIAELTKKKNSVR